MESASSVILSLQFLLVSSKKAVVMVKEALSQAKTVLEEAKLTLEIVVSNTTNTKEIDQKTKRFIVRGDDGYSCGYGGKSHQIYTI